MDDELAVHLAQRVVLLASDDASLGQLKAHDRKLLAAMERHAFASPIAQREGADAALLAGLETDFENALLIVEARARLWPGELGRVQQMLLASQGGRNAAWWLAAHYPALPCPTDFPGDGKGQVWASRALWRRNMADLLPAPWHAWTQALDGKIAVIAVAQALWLASGPATWQEWLAPLLTVADQDATAELVNWLATQTEDAIVIQVMGLSCQSRFLPWLASMRHNADLADMALREVRWLTGPQQQRHGGLQCWGEPLCADAWPMLFKSLPLGYRQRLWPWCDRNIEGAATSLQGGQWCAGV